MKKLALLCSMAMVLAALCVPQVYAVDITIWDTVGTAPISGSGEQGETEPGTVNSKIWWLESFQQSGATISMTGGYDFKNGATNPNYPAGPAKFLPGDLFIAKDVLPLFGATAPGGPGGGNGNVPVANSFGYNYAVIANFVNNTYTVYGITAGTNVDTAYYRQLDWSDPWKLTSTTGAGVTLVGTGTLAYTASAGDYTLDYVGLLGQIGTFGVADSAYLHYTYQCGNDSMMGQAFGSAVPVPPSVLLLGTGILGLVGLRWRRRKTNV